ncbi:tetratricopeptide repeat protein [Nonlabens sp.]|uniref:tetratricopeptide repeat protein n=1 Tax=Nonlabens sp. TaxID=1888209 RepID=UPI003F69FF54
MHLKLTFLVTFIYSWAVVAQLDQGDTFTTTGNWKAAIAAYESAPASAQKDFKLAQAYNQLGNTFKAIQFYEKGFQLDSTSIKPLYEYGKLFIYSQQHDKAVPVFQSLIKQQGGNATFYYYLGEAWSGLNQTELAITAYARALELNEEYRAARLDLIKNLIKKRDFAQAVRLAKTGIAMDPDDLKMNSYLAQAYVNTKLYMLAIPVFEHLLALGNETEYNRNGLAFSYYSDQQFEKAIEQYQIYMKDYDDKKPTVYYNLSVAYMKLEKYPEAIDAIETAIALRRPLLNKEFMQLAAVHARNGDIKNAFYALKAAQKERSDDPLINYQVAVAADRYFKDKNTIIPYYEKYIELHGENSDYGALASERLSDLKQAVFMNGDD